MIVDHYTPSMTVQRYLPHIYSVHHYRFRHCLGLWLHHLLYVFELANLVAGQAVGRFLVVITDFVE